MNEQQRAAPPAELLVCVTCRRGQEGNTGARCPGAHLLENISAAGPLEGLEIKPVECLSNCTRGCTIALRGAGRWTYVYGNLNEVSHVEMIREGAARYRDTEDGLVPWRERPEHFRKNCIARIPPLEVSYV